MTPRPSQPNRRKIKLGMKINKSIENTKNSTKIVNRMRNGSLDIYERENRRTLPEIKKMVAPNNAADGSRIIGKLIWWAVMVNRFHSRRVVVDVRVSRALRRRAGRDIVSNRRGA